MKTRCSRWCFLRRRPFSRLIFRLKDLTTMTNPPPPTIRKRAPATVARAKAHMPSASPPAASDDTPAVVADEKSLSTSALAMERLSFTDDADDTSTPGKEEQPEQPPEKLVSDAFVQYLAMVIPKKTAPVRVVAIPGKGRGVLAGNRKYAVGDTLWTETPVVALPFAEDQGSTCSWCFKQPAKLSRCTGCKLVVYCNRECQSADWSLHKHECAHLKSNPRVPTIVRFVSRLLQLKNAGALAWDRVQELASAELSTSEAEAMANALFAARGMVSNGAFLPPAEALHLMSQIQTNGIAIHHLDTMKGKAEALYLATSLVNHRCHEPNAVPIFTGRTLTLKCLRPINEGDEIVINYVEVCAPEWERRRELADNFHFECGCQLCVSERDLAATVIAAGKEVAQNQKRYIPHPVPTNITTMAAYRAAVANPAIDPRQLQDVRRSLVATLMAVENPDWPALESLATDLSTTYVEYLGTTHPVTLFFTLPALKARVYLLPEGPTGMTNDAINEAVFRAAGLRRGYGRWHTSMRMWVASDSDMRQYEVDEAAKSLETYLAWMTRQSRTPDLERKAFERLGK
ncbi:hypothetical protein BC828DRAFT_380378 [Blastocladiella britannica]|nr:hypothetical protein BC828DRAFT_380378 [Blastocladiella britannica]